MGYSTDFEGSFRFSKPLTVAQYKYLVKFADTRHVKKNIYGELSSKQKRELKQIGMSYYGDEGEFYLDEDVEILDNNVSPKNQPGLWCQWVPNEDGTELHWDGGDKFYHYVDWLKYYIKNFFSRWDIKLNGKVEFWGECEGDHGFIVVKDNVVSVVKDGDKTKTEKTNEIYNVQNYLKTLLGKKIVTVYGSEDTLVRLRNGTETEIVNNSKITNREIRSVGLTVYSRRRGPYPLNPKLYLELDFENSSDMYLIPVGNQLEII